METSKETVFDRVEHDVRRGDFGSARRRLGSYLATCGYDPAVLRRLGEISLEMKDPLEAGRYWLLSDVEGDEAERTIEAFVHSAGPDPRTIAAQLPRTCYLESVEKFPPKAQERIKKWRLYRMPVAGKPIRVPRESTGVRIAGFALIGGLLLFLICALVGAETIVEALVEWFA
ncbi:MAG: hypothetical protein J5J06_10180 [Phycisphaerae bacterium]|nr:hypothetical protein [Phycisphaerae bacterium]